MASFDGCPEVFHALHNGKTSSGKSTTFEAIKADMLKNKSSYRDIKIDDVAEIKNK